MARKAVKQFSLDNVREEWFGAPLEMTTWILKGETTQFAFLLNRVLPTGEQELVSRARIGVDSEESERGASNVWSARYDAKL